jgi:septin-2A
MLFARDNSANNSSNNFVDNSSLNTISGAMTNVVASTKDLFLSRASDNIKDVEKNKETRDRNSALTKDSDLNVGFSDLPNQIHRKTIKKGFEFTIMVVGKWSLGFFYLLIL